MASRRPTFNLAATTKPSAEDSLASDQPDPAQAVPDSPDIASKHASNTARKRTDVEDFTLDDMLAGRPDPEFDLVPVTVRVPRYYAQALDLYSGMTKRPQQAIVADGLAEVLPEQLLKMARARVEGR